MKARKEAEEIFFMREAISLADTHMRALDGGPFGAVIINREGEIIARGWNRVTSTNDPTAHAEVVCIRAACSHLDNFDLSGCTLYVNCEPCPMCLAAAYWARIDRIVYAANREDAAAIGFDDALIYEELTKDPQQRQIAMTQLLRTEALITFRQWEAFEDKIPY